MPIEIAPLIKTLLAKMKLAFNSLKSTDHSNALIQYKKHPENYTENASSILDYFIYDAADLLITELETFKPGFSIFGETAAIAMHVSHLLEKNGIYDAWEYFGNNHVPEVKSNQLYLKMVWVEWLLTSLMKGLEKGQLNAGFPLNQLFKYEIGSRRLSFTTATLNEYVNNHAEKKFLEQNLKTFREMYSIQDIEERFNAGHKIFDILYQSMNTSLIHNPITLNLQTEEKSNTNIKKPSEYSSTISVNAELSIICDKKNMFIDRMKYLLQRRQHLEIQCDALRKTENIHLKGYQNETNKDFLEKVAKARLNKLGTIKLKLIQNISFLETQIISFSEDETLLQAKQNITCVIQEHLRKVDDARFKPYPLGPIKRRATELMENVWKSQHMDGLKDVIAHFIITGQTQSDNLFQRSHVSSENCLRRMIIEAFSRNLVGKLSMHYPRFFYNFNEIKKSVNFQPEQQFLEKKTPVESRS